MFNDYCEEFFSVYTKMKLEDQEMFPIAVQRLLQINFLIHEKNKEVYNFIVRNKIAVASYLKLMNFDLKVKEENLLIYIESQDTKTKTKLYKLESIITLILRLIYQEKMNMVALTKYPNVKLGEIHLKISNLKLDEVRKERLAKTDLKVVLSKLRSYNIIDYVGSDLNDEMSIIIYPSIEALLNYRDLVEVKESLDSMLGGNIVDEDDKD